VGDVHSYDIERGFRFGGLIQLGHNEIQPPATLGVSVSALDSVSLAGISINLPLYFGVSFSDLSASERRARQPDAVLRTIISVVPRLVDPVRQYRRRIVAKLALVILHRGNQIVSLVEIAPTGSLQICITVNHGNCVSP